MDNRDRTAYFKFSGTSVSEGIIDSKIAGEALIGFSKSLKHIVKVQHPYLSDFEIHTPVKIQKGSWEALIPSSIEDWLTTALGVSATAYCVKVAQKLAENGFKEKTITDVVKDAVQVLIWTIRLSKHLGTTVKKKFDNLKWRNDNTEAGVSNEQKQILWVPVHILKIFHRIPESFYKGLIKAVEPNRVLRIGNYEGDFIDEVEITHVDKPIFVDEIVDDSEFIFPELEHGDIVKLEGYVTRGTETSNSIGFKYQERILNCSPEAGNIKKYKHCLFETCEITGEISRLTEDHKFNAPKPKIIFDELIPIESNEQQFELGIPEDTPSNK